MLLSSEFIEAGTAGARPREIPLATVVFSQHGKPTCKNIEWVAAKAEFRQLEQREYSTLSKLYYVHEVRGPITLEQRAGVRRDLSNIPSAALISGLLRSEFVDQLEPYHARFRTREPHRRSLKTFCDAPLPFLVVDIDHFDARKFDADFDARNGIHSVHDALRDVLESIGADFLITDRLVQASSRFGLINHHEFRGHVEWHLKTPMTLAQQKHLARCLNSRCEDKGLPRLFDESVYDAPRFLFTSRPQFVRRTSIGNRDRFIQLDDDELKTIGINATAERVSVCQIGEPLVELPEDLAIEIETVSRPPKRSKRPRTDANTVTLRKPGDGDERSTGHAFRMTRISEIRDGHTHEPVRDIIASISNERRDRWPQICERYLALVIKQIDETSPDQESRERRVNDHSQREQWLQKCNHARAKFDANGDGESRKRIFIDEAFRARVAIDDVATARTKLNGEMRRVVKESLTYDPAQCVGTGLIQQRERPSFTIFRGPPGIGKSTALLEALDPSLYGDSKVIIMAPTEKLAGQLSRDRAHQLKEALNCATYAEDVARDLGKHLRVLKGRAKLCIDKDGFGADAAQLETCGISPAKVCKVCTKRDACRYAQQDKTLVRDTFMVHAHLPTSIRKISDDEKLGLLVIDESIVPTLTNIPQCGSRRSLSELEREARRAKAGRSKRGSKPARQGRIEITADLIASLNVVNKILNGVRIAANGVGRIYATALGPLKTLRRRANAEGEELSKRAIDEAISEVRGWEYGAREALQKVIEERAGRRAAREAVRDLSLEIKQLRTTIECAAFYGVILEAFRGTIDNPARTEETDTVMGCWLFESAGEIHVHAQVHGRLPARLASVPIIGLDGTANVSALRSMVGHSHNLNVVETPAAPPPSSYYLIQYPDAPYGKAKFIDAQSGKSKKALTEIWKTICVEAARDYGEATCRREDGSCIDVLVACQQEVESALKKLGLPENVQTIHFNAERGINAYEGVSCGFVVGRPMPKTPELEARAEALHYDDPSVKVIHSTGDQKLTTGRRWLEMADGSRVEIPVESHPDPHVAELVRSQVDDEPRQAANRLRIYNRTNKNPARLFVFGRCDVGLPVHEIRRLIDSHRDVGDIMLASGVIAVDRKYVEIAHKNWIGKSDRAQRELTDAMAAIRVVTNPSSHTAIPISSALIGSAGCEGGLSHFARIEVKHPDARYRGTVWIDGRRHPDISKIVAETFGPDAKIIKTLLPNDGAVASSVQQEVSLSLASASAKGGRPPNANP